MNNTSLAERIAASKQDVDALLEDNHSLSVAYLARRIRDLEEEVRRLFRGISCPCLQVQAAEAAITKLENRLEQAAMKFKEMQEELDNIKSKQIPIDT